MTQAHAQVFITPGTPDPSFALNGLLKLPIPGIASHEAAAVLALPDRKLLVALPQEGNDAPLAIARLNEDGTLDKSFGSHETGFVEISLVNARISAVFGLDALQDGGWLVRVQYFTQKAVDAGQALIRLQDSGELDDSFGDHGISLLSYYEIPGSPLASSAGAKLKRMSSSANGSTGSVAQQADGKIVLLHFLLIDEPWPSPVVMRLLANGSLDQSFNGAGYVSVDVGATSSTAGAIAVQADGKVLVCGSFQNGETGSGVFLARLDAAGKLDKEFNNGQAKLLFNEDGERSLKAISVRGSDGRIVAVGDAWQENVHGGLVVVLTASGAANLVFNNGQPLFSPLLPDGLSWWHTSQLDGSIIVVGAGDSAVMTARFLADGKLDTAFNGIGYTLFDDVAGPVFPRDLAIMEDGRIVVSMTHTSLSDPSRVDGWIARYLSANLTGGTLDFDPSFGDSGIVRFPLGGLSEFDVRALLALPDNKLLVAVRRRKDGLETLIARLLENGQLDLEFGEERTGFVEISLKDGLYMHSMLELTPFPDGGWLVRAEYQNNGPVVSAGLVVVKQDKDGRLDQDFAEQGVRYLPYAQMGSAGPTGDAVLQLGDKILLVSSVEDGTGRLSGIVMRLNPDGFNDITFNGAGFAFVELAGIAHQHSSAQVVAHQPDGGVVVGGSYSGPSSGAYVIRFDANGQIDRSFGESGNGVVIISGEDDIHLSAISIVDGKIVLAGSAVRDGAMRGVIAVLTSKGSYNLVFNNGKPLFSDFVPQGLRWLHCVARLDGSIVVSGDTGIGVTDDDPSAITAKFLADGTPDLSFNGTGFSIFDEDGVLEALHDMTVLADGRIVVGGYFIGSFPNPQGWVIRYRG
jgi:uncharacterized delta-60 repeat protein